MTDDVAERRLRRGIAQPLLDELPADYLELTGVSWADSADPMISDAGELSEQLAAALFPWRRSSVRHALQARSICVVEAGQPLAAVNPRSATAGCGGSRVHEFGVVNDRPTTREHWV